MKSKSMPSLMINHFTRTLRNMIGVDPKGPEIKDVHPSLSSSAQLLSLGSVLFNDAVEVSLIKHKKQISDNNNQIIVKRISECAIDLFSMAAVLSRASRSLSQSSITSEHERDIAQTWCHDAIRRIRTNVQEVLNPSLTSDRSYDTIATNVLDNEGYKARHILDN